jgi:predicted PurR-regulated permease PerM
MSGNVMGVIGAVVTTLGILGGAIAYVVNLSVNYGQLQQSVTSMSRSIDSLTHQLEDTSRNLDGFQRFFMDFLAARNVTTGPLDLDRYQVPPHDHEAEP